MEPKECLRKSSFMSRLLAATVIGYDVIMVNMFMFSVRSRGLLKNTEVRDTSNSSLYMTKIKKYELKNLKNGLRRLNMPVLFLFTSYQKKLRLEILRQPSADNNTKGQSLKGGTENVY